MILLSPIHKKIRYELHKRIALVSRNANDISLINSPNNFNEHDIHPQSIYTKSTWLKLYSPVNNGFTMIGIETDNGKQKFGLNSLYHDQILDTTNNPYPGIKSISSEYKGGLKALRSATISWVAWSFDDIFRLKPYLWTPGNILILEWGWSSANLDNTIQTLTPSDIKDGIAYNNIQSFIINNGGNYDAMFGIITNFNWSLRDDGGFDCTTDIISKGIDMFSKNINPDSPLRLQETKSNNISEKKLKSTITFSAFIQQINKYFTGMVGAMNLNEEIVVSGKGIFNARRPNKGSWWANLFDTNTWSLWGPYITWGYLEDNILSRFLSVFSKDNVDKNGNPIFFTQFRSIEKTINDDNEEVISPTLISNSKYLYTSNKDIFILPGQFPSDNFDIGSSDSEIKQIVDIFSNEFEPFKYKNDDTRGILRNILLSWNVVYDSFNKATSLESGMKSLFGRLNEETGGFWNFQMVTDEYGNVSVIDTNITYKSPKKLIDSKSKYDGTNVTGELFEFPIWSKNTIVSNISMESKLPNAMAMIAMYGNNTNLDTSASSGDREINQFFKNESAHTTNKLSLKHAWQIEQFGSDDPYNIKIPLSTNSGLKLKLQNTSVINTVTPNTKTTTIPVQDIAKSKKIKSFTSAIKYNKKMYNKKGIMINDTNYQYHDTMKYMINKNPDTAPAISLLPIELTITINGIGGIFPGDCFTINYLPEYYKETTVFQIISVNQSVDDSGWKTEINGIMRADLSMPATKSWLQQSADNIDPIDDTLHKIGYNNTIIANWLPQDLLK